MSNLKKFLTIGVTVMTVLWSVGVSLAPLGASAAASAGDLIKMAGNSAVYYFDGSKRYVFPNETTYKSWYKDFSSVKTVPASELQSYAIGGNVTIRPGTKLVKITTDPKVYAISTGGELHAIDSEARAAKLYGSNWNKMIVDVPDAFFVNYKTGAAISSDVHVNGTLVKYSGSSTYYLVEDGKKRPFASEAALAANMIDTANAIVTDVTYSDGTSITGKESTLTNVAGSSTPGQVVTGNVTVALSSTSPASSTLVTGQATAKLASFTFTGTGTVTSLTLKRTGVSADGTLQNVYLFDGATRITDAATVSSGNVTFANSAGLFTVAGSKTVDVLSDILTNTSGQTVGVSIETAASISGVTVSGTFPVASAIHTIASATLAGVTVGTPEPSSAATTDAQNDVRVWESNFTVSTRDVTFSRLALRQINSIESKDINNFRLLVDGVQLAQVASLDSNGYVTFSGFTKKLTTGTRVIKVLADVVGGSSRIVQMSLRNKADVDLMDSEYNVNIAASGTFAASTANLTVNAGSMTVVKATNSPSGNVTDAASDVVLAKYTFTAYGEPIKVESLTVDFTHLTSADAAETSTLRNGKIMVNGSQVGSTTTLNPASTGTQFTGLNFVVNPGTPATIEVRSDLFDNDGTNAVSTGDKITATLSTGSGNGTKQTSLGTINVPSSNISGNQLVIASGSMTLAAQTTYPSQTVVVPQTAFKIGAWNLSNGDTEDINIHTLSLDIDETTGTTFSESDITDMYLKYGTSMTTIKSTATAADNNWSVSFTLAKNQVLPIELYANLGSTVAAGDAFKTDLTVTGTGASSSTSVSQDDKDGQTITYNAGSLTATKDASSSDAKLLDDAGTVNVAAFKFASVNDSYTVTDVTVTIPAATTVQNVILKDGATTLATKPGATSVAFSGLSWSVPANTNKVLSVDLQLSTVGVAAGTSGETVTVSLSAATARNSQGVSAAVSGLGSPVAANAMYVYKAIPTITNVTLPSSLLGTGTQTLAKFSVNTNGTGTIGWKKLVFTVTKTGAAADDPAITNATLWDADTNTEIAGTDTIANLGATDASGTISFVATDEQQISGAKTYELRATVTATLATGDNINTSIAQGSSYVAPDSYADVETAGTASFIWTDQSASSHSATTNDWNNSYLVKNLPTNTQTLTK